MPVGDLLAVVAVALGATAQRLTGLGFALVAAPFLVVLLGPHTGVTLANVLSIAICLIVLAGTFRHLERRLAATLAAGAVIAVPLGALVVRTLPTPVLLIGVGTLTAGSVLWVVAGRELRLLRRRGGAVVAGLASGFCNTTAATGGPPLAVYAASTGWPQRAFVPSVQLVGLVSNGLSVAAKGPPAVSLPFIAICGVAMAAGLLGGQFLTRRVSEAQARRVMLLLALGGSLLAVGKGVTSL
ncbi:sulfite exporter TauE/SafE family protein [Micromonospora sp. NPDC002389]|uniref:sulfite exporter TauE/SafE family protein n=1 Tax=unclassified Micromonospora TaxID=2617518 RepID=UPI00332F5959